MERVSVRVSDKSEDMVEGPGSPRVYESVPTMHDTRLRNVNEQNGKDGELVARRA